MNEVNSYGGHDTSTCDCMNCDINFGKLLGLVLCYYNV